MLNHLDKDFAKLKVKGYDKNGNEIIAKLSDVAPSIDLAQFIKADITNYGEELIKHNRIDESKIDYRLTNNASNPFTKFRPEFRYEKISDDELENFFATYADKDGWVDLSKHHREIFNESSVFSNFAYTKIDMNGNVILSEFNPILSNKKMDKNFSYSRYQKELQNFEKDRQWLIKNLNDYNVENKDELIKKLNQTKSPYLIALENEFKKITGVKFSGENLHKLKEHFSSNSNKASIFLKDADSVIAMKRSKSGAITLKFSSGREIVVNELYSDSGKLLGDKNRRVGLNLNAKKMSEDELNILVSKHSDTTAIKKPNGKFKTLKGLGVKTIKKLSNNLFHLILHDNSQFSAKELYNITFMDKFLSRFANNFLKDNDEFLSTNSKNSSNATKIFFQKVNARV